jgi:hypothetical protein
MNLTMTDVIGCELDWSSSTISFYRNGEPLGVAFRNLEFAEELFPVSALPATASQIISYGWESESGQLVFSAKRCSPDGVRSLNELVSKERQREWKSKLRNHNTLEDRNSYSAYFLMEPPVANTMLQAASVFTKDGQMLRLLMNDEKFRANEIAAFKLHGITALWSFIAFQGNETSMNTLWEHREWFPELWEPGSPYHFDQVDAFGFAPL